MARLLTSIVLSVRAAACSNAYDLQSVSSYFAISPHQVRLNALRRCLESGMPIACEKEIPQELRPRPFSQARGPLVRAPLLGARSSTWVHYKKPCFGRAIRKGALQDV